jgi:leader peptidase (prepilin peptidase) / N-methyltransferase
LGFSVPGPLLEILLSVPMMALFGLCIGSFLNVVIHRMPLMLERDWKHDSAELLGVKTDDANANLTLSKPASRCPHCGHVIAWYENIPVLSYLRLGGKCSACKAPISARYPAIEIITAALFGAVAWKFGAQPVTALWCAFVAVLVALAGIDWDTTLLPDNLTLPLLWAGLLASALGWTIPLSASVWGAIAGYLSLWSVYWLFKLATGKEGMGYGDFKLLAALGAWLGVSMVLPVILASSIIGAIVGIAMKLSASLREGRYVPFGPFLAGAGLAVLFIGSPRVMGWLGWA